MHVHAVLGRLPETYFPLFIANGVTGVRDMAADLGLVKQLRKDINEGKRVGPRIVAGQMVDGPMPVWPGLELFVKAGLNPMEALQTATRNPAIYLGLIDTVGTVEKGKQADLVLLEANPLENISNTKRISAVVVGGRLIPKVSLDKMLLDVERAANRN